MVRGSRIGVALALLVMTACGDEEDGRIPCERDFDCPVGQVCGDAGLCTDAAPGEEKEFGEVSLAFSTDTDTYLLAVYALPTEAEAASFDFVSFAINQGGTPASGLRWEAAPAEPEPRYDADYWADRIAFEAQRREGIESVARDLRAARLSFGNRAVPKQAHACADGEFYFPDAGDCATNGNLQFSQGGTVTAHVAGTVPDASTSPKVRVKVIVEGLDTTNDPNARSAAGDFADAASTVLAAFGESSHGAALDRNEDGTIAIVFTPRVADVGTNVVGFFEFRDFMDAGTSSGGKTATDNEADLLWAQVPSQRRSACPTPDGCASTAITHELVVGTLAHEYTHLITYARRVHSAGTSAQNEVLWLDEGMAHMMEDATGWGASNIGAVAEAFTNPNWPNTLLAGPQGDVSSDTPAQRGMAYLYLRHLVEQRATGASDAADVNITLPGELITDTELGFLHPAIANRGADGFWRWLLATFATEHPDVTESAAHAADYLPLANDADTGQPIGVNPNGEYVDARNATVPLSSDDIVGDGSTDELTETDFPFESEIGVSGSMLFKVISSETGTTTLTGTGPAEVDLQMRAVRVW